MRVDEAATELLSAITFEPKSVEQIRTEAFGDAQHDIPLAVLFQAMGLLEKEGWISLSHKKRLRSFWVRKRLGSRRNRRRWSLGFFSIRPKVTT